MTLLKRGDKPRHHYRASWEMSSGEFDDLAFGIIKHDFTLYVNLVRDTFIWCVFDQGSFPLFEGSSRTMRGAKKAAEYAVSRVLCARRRNIGGFDLPV
jgi:hypothetical protein